MVSREMFSIMILIIKTGIKKFIKRLEITVPALLAQRRSLRRPYPNTIKRDSKSVQEIAAENVVCKKINPFREPPRGEPGGPGGGICL